MHPQLKPVKRNWYFLVSTKVWDSLKVSQRLKEFPQLRPINAYWVLRRPSVAVFGEVPFDMKKRVDEFEPLVFDAMDRAKKWQEDQVKKMEQAGLVPIKPPDERYMEGFLRKVRFHGTPNEEHVVFNALADSLHGIAEVERLAGSRQPSWITDSDDYELVYPEGFGVALTGSERRKNYENIIKIMREQEARNEPLGPYILDMVKPSAEATLIVGQLASFLTGKKNAGSELA